jgi:hypothetical protein
LPLKRQIKIKHAVFNLRIQAEALRQNRHAFSDRANGVTTMPVVAMQVPAEPIERDT